MRICICRETVVLNSHKLFCVSVGCCAFEMIHKYHTMRKEKKIVREPSTKKNIREFKNAFGCQLVNLNPNRAYSRLNKLPPIINNWQTITKDLDFLSGIIRPEVRYRFYEGSTMRRAQNNPLFNPREPEINFHEICSRLVIMPVERWRYTYVCTYNT